MAQPTPLIFTNHARSKMIERGITEEMVRFVHDTPADRVRVAPDGLLNLYSMVRGVPVRVTIDPFQEVPLIVTVALASERQLEAA